MDRFQIDKIKVLRGAGVLAVLVLSLLALKYQPWNSSGHSLPAKNDNSVTVPTIVNGQLVLPKLITTQSDNSLNLNGPKLGIVSANLVPVFDPQSQQITAIRILGETLDIGSAPVRAISPVIKFYDKDNKVLGQKVGRLSTGFDFLGIGPTETTVYDVTVDNPPVSDKLEILINSESASDSALFEPFLIASRSMEVKTATYQGNPNQTSTSSSQSTSSGAVANPADQVEYYIVSGSVINGMTDPVTDISVYSWVKDKDNLVYALAKQDFKNDLLQPGDKLDFRILLLPLKNNEHYETYGLVAKGKRYKPG